MLVLKRSRCWFTWTWYSAFSLVHTASRIRIFLFLDHKKTYWFLSYGEPPKCKPRVRWLAVIWVGKVIDANFRPGGPEFGSCHRPNTAMFNNRTWDTLNMSMSLNPLLWIVGVERGALPRRFSFRIGIKIAKNLHWICRFLNDKCESSKGDWCELTFTLHSQSIFIHKIKDLVI